VVQLENPENDLKLFRGADELIAWCRNKIEKFRNVCSANVPTPIPMGWSTFLINLPSEKDRREFDMLPLKLFDSRDDECHGHNVFPPDAPLVLRRREWLYYLERNIALSSIGVPASEKQWREDLTELLQK
jgi:hypothetical protein